MRLDFTLLADGSSDRVLLPVVRWVFEQHVERTVPVTGQFADFARLPARPAELHERMIRAVELFACNVLVVHRDAESPDPEPRFEETKRAYDHAGLLDRCPILCVVPVRATEAWLLFDEPAIRRAAGNPNGVSPLSLPKVGDCEQIANPKSMLFEALTSASELKGRRRKTFRRAQARARLGDLIEDFSPLRALSAFERFETDVKLLVDRLKNEPG